jgi:hypothetical protein
MTGEGGRRRRVRGMNVVRGILKSKPKCCKVSRSCKVQDHFYIPYLLILEVYSMSTFAADG